MCDEPIILVIDDDLEFLDGVKTTLQRLGFKATIAESGEVGLRVARKEQPRMILCDYLMPGLDGLEVLRELRSDPMIRHIPLHIVSSADEARDHLFRENARMLGAWDVLDKRTYTDRNRLVQYLSARLDLASDLQNPNLNYNSQLTQRLKVGLEKTYFFLEYQPKASILENRICGMEALIRWGGPGPPIRPDELIMTAERCGLIHELGLWVIEEAAEFTNLCLAIDPNLVCAINISPLQLSGDLKEYLPRILSHAPGKNLEFEITETIEYDTEVANEFIKWCHTFDIKVAMDDYGTGNSRSSQLIGLNVDSIKIDRSFFARYKKYPQQNQTILDHMIKMFKSLEKTVVAEGVEESDILDFLKKCGCDQLQGYLYSKPLAAEDFLDFLKANKPLF